MEIKHAANGHWPAILDALGIAPHYLQNKHGPCPICGGKDRFRFDDKERNGTYICSQCGAGNGFTLLMKLYNWSYPETLERVERVLRIRPKEASSRQPLPCTAYLKRFTDERNIQSTDNNKRKEKLNTLWQEAKPIVIADPVELYLRSRGIKLTAFPPVLRHHPALPYYDGKTLKGRYHAMLARIADCNDNGVAILRTYLGNGCKANVPSPKKLVSPIFPGALNGAAIKLFEPFNGLLAIAEGIETSLAFHLATALPVWASISANGMEKLILPESVNEVVIAVDNDESGRGQKAALILTERLIREGRKVKRVLPPEPGTDFADLLMRGISK